MNTVLLHIWQQLKKNKKLSIWYALLVIISEIAFLSSPFLIAVIINQINAKEFNQLTWRYAIIGVTIWSADEIASRIANTIKSSLVVRARNSFSTFVIESIQKKDYLTLNERGTGKLQKRIDNGCDAYISFFYNILSAGESVILRGAIIMTILAIKAPMMIGALIIIVGTILGVHYCIKNTTHSLQEQINTSTEQQGSQKTKMIMNYLFFRVWNANKKESATLHKEQDRLIDIEPRNELLNELPFTTMAIGFRVWELGVYLYYGYQYIQGDITMGIISLLVTYIRRLRRPVQNLLNNMSSFRKNINRRKRLQELINTPTLSPSGSKVLNLTQGEIRVEKLSFGFNNNLLFNNFSCHFSARKHTALVGHSGSGKSTLIKLILKLYTPSQGSITIDGQDIQAIITSSRYDHIGYISQEPDIIEGTIASNLAYGLSSTQRKDLTKDERETLYREALRYAQLDKLIQSKPKQLATKIGEKGIKLSGGEKQRLALARLFLKNPPIIILDEPTSGLDSLSEHHITASLQTLTAGKTVIIIAHRLQTVMHADHIIVMDQGSIVEQGTHTELINHNGVYAQLVDLQHGMIRE